MRRQCTNGGVTYEIKVASARLDSENNPGLKVFRYYAEFRVRGETAWVLIVDRDGLPAYSDSDGNSVLAAKEFLRGLAVDPASVG